MSARHSSELAEQLERLSEDLANARSEAKRLEERYRAVLDNSSEAIWCCELDAPIPIDLPEDEQIDLMFDRAWLSEANSPMAEMYGYKDPAELIGVRLPELLVRTDPDNIEYLRAFVRAGYRLREAESHEIGSDGKDRYFLNNLTGVVEYGMLLRAWGTQRDVSRQKLNEERAIRITESHETLLAVEKEARREAEHARDEHQQVEQQVSLLVEASSVLLRSLSETEVIETILSLARRFVAADAYAVWRRDRRSWRVVSAAGLSEAYKQTLIEASAEWTAAPKDPVIVRDMLDADIPTFRERADLIRAEGLRSLFSVPLSIRGFPEAFITFYYRTVRDPSQAELRTASALGNLAATAIATSELYEEQRAMRAAAEQAQQRSEFLAEASSVLASSLDYETTLAAVARLAVPRLADWCAVDIALEGGTYRRIAVTHSDPDRVQLAHELARRYPPRPDDPIPRALRTGEAHFVSEIPPSVLEQAARDPEHLEILRQLGLRSFMVVPLLTRERVVGAISFVTAESRRIYREPDVLLAKELARRAAIAVDNAQLYASAEQRRAEAEAAVTALKRSNEDLQQFAYIASHDLQEPLRTIASYTQLLARRYRANLDEQADEFVGFIVDAARRMSELIQDLLAYSRAANTQESRPPETVRMKDVLAAVATNLKAAIQESGAEIVSEELPVVKADPAQMVQLLQNLIANAIKYRSSAPPRISVSAEQAGDRWIFSVRDNGMGIDPRYAQRIFGIFKRLHGSKYPGTGVGLAICKRIVERHGGEIWVESQSGSGSVFKFSLPLDGRRGHNRAL